MSLQRQYVALGGGIDTETPMLSVPAGFVREAWNFEQAIHGGYSRVAGYERVDGRPAPSEATYVELPFLGLVALGSEVVGVTSGATGTVIGVSDESISVGQVTGVFDANEDIEVSSVVVGSITGEPLVGGDLDILAIAADIRRDVIQPVPGSGPIRGVFKLAGSVFAFRDDALVEVKRLYRTSAGGWVEVTTPDLLPGGFLQTTSYNFGSGETMFGCDGTNKAFRFDGTTYTEITTGMTDDRPKYIAAHQNHLFLAFAHSVQHSAIGDPMDWTPLLGAGEINVGAPVTNMFPQPGSQGSGALAISTDGSLFVLYGTSAGNWSLVPLQSEVGAKDGSMQNIGVAFMLSDMGVTIIGQSQEYGNFAHSVVSARANGWMRQFAGNVTASTIHHAKNQYRLFFGTRGLFITVQGRKVMGMMPVEFPDAVRCCTTTADDEFYWGGDLGYVYRGERGSSFDGAEIGSLMTFPFNSSKTLRQRKRYRRMLVELTAEYPVEMTANFTFAHGDSDILFHEAPANQINVAGNANWDQAIWDISSWDGGINPIARIELEGVGDDIAVALSHSSRTSPAFAIRSFILEFSPRRGER